MINLLIDLLLPPASLAVFALLLLLSRRRVARVCARLVLICLIALGLPVVGTALLNSLSPPEQAGSQTEPQAIVILSADGIRVAPPVDLEPGVLTLDRMRAGAALARRVKLPVLVSGGLISDFRTSLAAMMDDSLREDFGIQVTWLEDRSRDTWENAEFSAAILQRAGIRRIYLVTHDWHMRRSLLAFRHFGLDPVPVPVRPAFTPPAGWRRLLINPAAWFNSYVALHEWVGLAYYSIRG